MTTAQQRPVGGPSIPGQEKTSITSLGIDIGSRYASQLGFEGMEAYQTDSSPKIVLLDAPASPGAKKKKKKNRRKKKEKQQDEKQEPDGINNNDDEEHES